MEPIAIIGICCRFPLEQKRSRILLATPAERCGCDTKVPKERWDIDGIL
jgi:acyl transferase domain-containing protein